MKKTIYDCWRCRHCNTHNPYGIEYCDLYDTRCNFANDNCDYSDPDPMTDDELTARSVKRGLTFIGWHLLAIIATALLCWAVAPRRGMCRWWSTGRTRCCATAAYGTASMYTTAST